MNLFRSIETSASALTAERLRLDVIAENIANANTTSTAEGGPYRRKVVQFFPRMSVRAPGDPAAVGTGVRVAGIARDPSPFKLRYDPGHPDADAQGYVAMPNVDVVKEMVDMITATRSYEANVTAMNAAKTMFLRALDIGRA